MPTYEAAQAKAQRKIAEKGIAMEYVSVQSGAYDPVSNAVTETETRTAVYGLKSSPTVREVQSGAFPAGSMVVRIAGGLIENPSKVTDHLEFDGRVWDISEIRKVEPGGVCILLSLSVEDGGAVPAQTETPAEEPVNG